MLHVSAEKSTGDGEAVMVDEFWRKMKGCDGEWGCMGWLMCVRVMLCDVRGEWIDGVRGRYLQIPCLLRDVINIIDVKHL
jgi:hypothetical protein